jgi:hypothetical protein
LRRDPQARSSGAARQISKHCSFAQCEVVRHDLKLVVCEEADVSELSGERATVGVVSPQPREGRTRCGRSVDRVVAVHDSIEDTVMPLQVLIGLVH